MQQIDWCRVKQGRAHAGSRHRPGLRPCARGGPEWILATGYGSQQPKNPTATVIAALFGARAAYAVTSKTSATAELDAVVPFSHPYFYIGESSGVGPRVFTVPVAAARGTLGVSVAF